MGMSTPEFQYRQRMAIYQQVNDTVKRANLKRIADLEDKMMNTPPHHHIDAYMAEMKAETNNFLNLK